MKFPSHIILDINKQNISYSSQLWVFKYVSFFKHTTLNNFTNFFIHKKFLFKKENLFLNKLTMNQNNFTISYSLSNPTIFLSENDKKFLSKVYKPRIKVTPYDRYLILTFYAKKEFTLNLNILEFLNMISYQVELLPFLLVF